MSGIARFVAGGFQQQYLSSSLDGKSAANLVVALHFEGPFDEHVLERALRQLVTRHEALRTTLHPGNPPEQWVAVEQPLELERIVLANTGDVRAAALDMMADGLAQPFQLHGGSLMRTTLAQLGPRDHVVMLVVHHALVDGWSIRLLARDLTVLYRAAAEGKDPVLPKIELGPPDHATWEQASQHEHAEWWCRLLGDRGLHGSIGPPQPLAPIRPTVEYHERQLATAATVERLQAFVARSRLTTSSTLMAAISTTLTTWNAHDTVMGLVVANREHPGLRSTVGFLADFLPVRVDASGDPTFAELAERIHAATQEAYAHRIPFAALHRALGNDGPWHAARVLDLIVNYLPMRVRRAGGRQLGDSSVTAISELTLPMRRYRWELHQVRFQPAGFAVPVLPDGETLRGGLEAEPQWLPKAHRLALEETLIAVFERAVARPDARISELLAAT